MRYSAHDHHLPLPTTTHRNMSRSKPVVPFSKTFRLSFKTLRVRQLRELQLVERIRDQMPTVSSGTCSRKCEIATLVPFSPFRLAPEVAHVRPWWSYLGGGAGAVLGYVVANVPGAVAGGTWFGWQTN
jgi:hypothetical protein